MGTKSASKFLQVLFVFEISGDRNINIFRKKIKTFFYGRNLASPKSEWFSEYHTTDPKKG